MQIQGSGYLRQGRLGRRGLLRLALGFVGAGTVWLAHRSRVWAEGITAIAPDSGMVGDEFTIIDTAATRLAAGAVAVFKDGAG